jgi:hypothetical protein
MRTIQRGLRLTKQEAADLDAVAASYGLDWPSCVRMLVKRERDLARGLAQAVAPKKPVNRLRQLRRKPKAAAETVKPTVSDCGGYPDVVGSDETVTGVREDSHHVIG